MRASVQGLTARLPRRLAVLTTVAVVVAAPRAHASPLGDPVIDRAVFGGTTAAQATSIRLNPAALSRGAEGTHFYVVGSAMIEQLSVQRRDVDPDTGALSPGATVDATLWDPGNAIGGALGWYRVGGRFVGAAQISMPQADRQPAGEEALGYHALGGSHREIFSLALGGAYRISRRAAIGAAYRLVQSRLTMSFLRDTALEANGRDPARGIGSDCGGMPCGLEHPQAAERYQIEATSTSILSFDSSEVQLGAVVELVEGWWLGVSYELPLGLFLTPVELTGTVDVTRAPRDGGETLDGEVSVSFLHPDRLRAGVRGRVAGGLDVVAEARWENLSRMAGYDLRMYGLSLADAGVPEWYPRPRGLHDRLTLHAGAEQVDTGQPILAGARVGIERGAVDDARLSAMTALPMALTVDLGVQARLGNGVILQLSYGLAWSPDVDTGTGAYDPLDRLACIESGYDVTTEACAAVRAGYALPTASGVYGRTRHGALLVVRYDR